MKLYYALKKEFLILWRNKSALLSLFLMPAIFILIMSLAQKDIYKEYTNANITYTIVNQDKGQKSLQFIDALKDYEHLTFIEKDSLEEAQALTREGDTMFTLRIAKAFSAHFDKKSENPLIDIYMSPSTKAPVKLYFQSKIKETMMALKMKKILKSIGKYDDTKQDAKDKKTIETHYLYDNTHKTVIPTATQQNVPAWIVFSMFFVIIPISTLFITERDDGTLDRLKAMNSPKGIFLLSKIIPYMVINQLQLYSMILVGLFLVPLLGGDKLTMDIDFFALFVISLAISFAAIGFALFLSTLMKSIEQASIVGALSAVIMGAVGGIMIPKLVMPPLMQDLTLLSPMSWGLEGMLDVFVRNLDVSAVLYEASVLVVFGILMLTISTYNFKRR
ncbi:MAG: ABC transporter permease [Sulfurovum sp.]|nr:ABC transporter permease [Sulfurovum sp.]